jgi:chemotaxis protein histidine kinase CheA
LPAKTERLSSEGDPEDLQRQVAEAAESHLRRLVVGLLELHDQPGDPAVLVQVRDEARGVASALLTVDLDHLSSAARAINDTIDALAAGRSPVPPAAVVALLDATAGLRALVAARSHPESPAAQGETLERELAALAPWHPVTAALRAASAAPGRLGGSTRPSPEATAGSPSPEASAGSQAPEASAGSPAEDAVVRVADPAARLRVVPTVDLRTAGAVEAHPGSVNELSEVLTGLCLLADVLVRATATLQGRLTELTQLPEFVELEAALQALTRAPRPSRAAADRRR